MSSLKGTSYPKLVDTMKSVVNTHAAITSDVAKHAKASGKKREDERTRLGMVHAAKAVLDNEGTS